MYVNAPVHGCAAVTMKHVPVHGWQHAPVPPVGGGQGFGVQEVNVVDTVPAGHGVPSATLRHAPVAGSQQMWLVLGGQVMPAHVWPG